jgi:hypothetical protein
VKVKGIQRIRHYAEKSWEVVHDFKKGTDFGRDFPEGLEPTEPPAKPGELERYFDEHLTGPGLFKWRHYFSIYERHFAKFRGRPVVIVEIGIFSGGSLAMWRTYFGDAAQIVGVDIEPACRQYEGPNTRVFIGDQSDPDFWKRFVQEVPEIDIIIDDGGHRADQQIPTLEALLPHLRPGGVYLCEDMHGRFNAFQEYLNGLAGNLHAVHRTGKQLSTKTTRLQRSIDSIHLYPFVAVIEKRSEFLDELIAPKHGTEWQIFVEGPKAPDAVGGPD